MSDCPVKVKLDIKLKIPLRNEELVINSVGDANTNPCSKGGIKLKPNDHELDVVNSCNGFLCLSEPFKYRPSFRDCNPVIVCNPITCEFINLPAATIDDESRKYMISMYSLHCGLGFSPKTNQYKVIWIRYPFSREERDIGSLTEIHTLGTGTWKRIGDAPSTLHRKIRSPTYLNGSLHWFCHGVKYSNSITSFDFDNEEFQSLPPPPFKPSGGMNFTMALGEIRGCLCICYVSGFAQSKVWVMKEYGVQGSWNEEYCFSTEVNVGRRIHDINEPISVMRNGAILLFHNFHCSKGALFYHDPKKPCFRLLKLKGYKSSYQVIAHIPSFISLKDAVKGDDLVVLNTKSRCAEFKLQGESKDLFLVEEDLASDIILISDGSSSDTY